MSSKQKNPGAGHNSGTIAQGKLRSLFERLELNQEAIDERNAAKKDIYDEARAMGFDPKIMRIVQSRRKQDTVELQERDATIELYETALSGTKRRPKKKTGTENATRARAREEADDG